MTVDMSKYLGLFVTESTEHLEALSRDLVALEQSPNTQETIDSMFRHAHSVKGMASSMGLESIAVVAHRVEDLVDAVRQDASALDRPLVDLLLAATDHLLEQVKLSGAGQPLGDGGTLLAALSDKFTAMTGRSPKSTRVADARFHETPSAATPTPEASAVAVVEPKGPLQRLQVRVRILPTCQVPGVRAFLVHKRLSLLGTLVSSKPPLEDLKAGRIPEGLMTFEVDTTSGTEGVSQALTNVAEAELLEAKIAALVPPSPTPPSPDEAQKAQAQDSARTIRVRTDLLDYFLETAGELILASAQMRELAKTLPPGTRPRVEESVDRLHLLAKDLHTKVMGARMTPVSVLTDRLPRAARDIARKREREVDLVVTGAEVELDRAILDELTDPLLHILRNCIDHGIESPAERAAQKKGPRGRVLVSVRRERDRVLFEIEDDGRGMDVTKLRSAAVARGQMTAESAARLSDREALMLACLPGVSTAEGVSEISGRGVGMDAVKRAVENVGGTLDIESEPGRGTRFVLKLPLTVAVVNLLLVGVGEEIFGLPIAKVVGAVEADEVALSKSREAPLLAHGSGLLPVHGLSELLGVPPGPRQRVRPFVVVEGNGGSRFALAVDRLLGQEEAVLKALSRPLDLVSGLAGVTILGSGRPVFILDVPRLLH
ncbi:MAG: chemotaxis protein CheW [Myxococcaceae bacterium]